jgi:hypothetical protein
VVVVARFNRKSGVQAHQQKLVGKEGKVYLQFGQGGNQRFYCQE